MFGEQGRPNRDINGKTPQGKGSIWYSPNKWTPKG